MEDNATMLQEYLARAMARATYDKLEDGTFVGEVPGLQGVIANAERLERCRDQLVEVIEEWVLVHVARGLEVPELDGVTVKVIAA